MEVKDISLVSKLKTLYVIRNSELMSLCLAQLEVEYLETLPEKDRPVGMLNVRKSQVKEHASKVQLADQLIDDEEERLKKERNGSS